MKAINKLSIVKTIAILFTAIIFQSCSSSNEAYKKNEEPKSVTKSNVSNENVEATQEELEQAAALLLLAAVANEIDNSSNENYANEDNYTDDEVDYDGKDYDKGTAMIKDRIETEIGSNIVYE